MLQPQRVFGLIGLRGFDSRRLLVAAEQEGFVDGVVAVVPVAGTLLNSNLLQLSLGDRSSLWTSFSRCPFLGLGVGKLEGCSSGGNVVHQENALKDLVSAQGDYVVHEAGQTHQRVKVADRLVAGLNFADQFCSLLFELVDFVGYSVVLADGVVECSLQEGHLAAEGHDLVKAVFSLARRVPLGGRTLAT